MFLHLSWPASFSHLFFFFWALSFFSALYFLLDFCSIPGFLSLLGLLLLLLFACLRCSAGVAPTWRSANWICLLMDKQNSVSSSGLCERLCWSVSCCHMGWTQKTALCLLVFFFFFRHFLALCRSSALACDASPGGRDLLQTPTSFFMFFFLSFLSFPRMTSPLPPLPVLCQSESEVASPASWRGRDRALLIALK